MPDNGIIPGIGSAVEFGVTQQCAGITRTGVPFDQAAARGRTLHS